jgi:hypothetical protein
VNVAWVDLLSEEAEQEQVDMLSSVCPKKKRIKKRILIFKLLILKNINRIVKGRIGEAVGPHRYTFSLSLIHSSYLWYILLKK